MSDLKQQKQTHFPPHDFALYLSVADELVPPPKLFIKPEIMPKIGPYGNDTMRMNSNEAGILRSMMSNVRIDDIPKPSELHQSNQEFLRFSHKSFGNVYTGIKNKLKKSNESVPPDSDEEAEEAGELFSPCSLRTHQLNFSTTKLTLLPFSTAALQTMVAMLQEEEPLLVFVALQL